MTNIHLRFLQTWIFVVLTAKTFNWNFKLSNKCYNFDNSQINLLLPTFICDPVANTGTKCMDVFLGFESRHFFTCQFYSYLCLFVFPTPCTCQCPKALWIPTSNCDESGHQYKNKPCKFLTGPGFPPLPERNNWISPQFSTLILYTVISLLVREHK